MGPDGGNGQKGPAGGNRAAPKERKPPRSPSSDDAGRVWRMGAGKTILPGLRAGDFHFGKLGFQFTATARSCALRRGATAAKDSHGDLESRVAGRHRTPPAIELSWAPAEILLRDSGTLGAADFSAFR